MLISVIVFVQVSVLTMSTALTSSPWLASQPEEKHTFPRNSPGTSTGLALTQKVICFIASFSC